MKWKFPLGPKEGDTRKRAKFAWLPVFVHGDTELYKVWLETYRITEQYNSYTVSCGDYFRCIGKWRVIKREPLFWEHE